MRLPDQHQITRGLCQRQKAEDLYHEHGLGNRIQARREVRSAERQLEEDQYQDLKLDT